ncbi:SCP-like protein [Ancylostoma duodenale]|uniref:SCP-like protein n=1 Tax=Ancylostoma duodenale TaxID=51022 RepID=A0A0C2GT90_9BILA|nr:SCP-like protein [Ancylostoma duodenale]
MTAENRLPQTTAMLSSVLALVAVAVSVLDAAIPSGGYQCWNFASTDEIRYEYLTVVNNLRKQIAQGTAQCKGKTCPAGKNIYRLDWDCMIEIEAQKVADQCTESPRLPQGLSALVKKAPMTTCNPKPLFKQTVKGWWDDVQTEGLGDKPLFDNEKLADFAKLAHGKATRIGCAQKNCDGNLYVACMLYPE